MNHFVKITFLCSLALCNLLCNAETNQVIIDKITKYDLDLTCKDKTTLTEVIKTVTQAGQDSIEPFFLQPTDSIETLHKRQEIILFLLEKNTLYAALKEQLQVLASHETALSLENNQQLSQEALKQVYYTSDSFKKFNTSPIALDAAYALHITGLCLPAIEYLIFHAGIKFLTKAEKNTDSHKQDHAHQDKKHHEPHQKNHHNDHKHGDHAGHDHAPKKHAQPSCCDAHISPNSGNFAFYSFHGVIFGMHISPLYHMVEDVQNRAVMIKHLQEQMIHIATYVKTAQEIFDLLKNQDAEKLNFAPYQELAYFFDESPRCSTEAQDLLTLLQESTFTGNASFLNHVGNVLAAYKLYVNVHQEFHKITRALGEIDLYVSAADMIKNQTTAAPWCFVNYKKSAHPSILAKNMRHLFIPETLSKSWNINTTESLHTFITGDNGSGKSTYINGLGHALILAQTFGIAPAEQFEMTPFSHICTYRFIEDNMVQGTSRFYAECGRIETILTTVNESSCLSCVLLDEPFTSTNAQKGADFLTQALARLFSLRNTISFTASHYGSLSALAKEHKNTVHLHLR